jgi:hypothetical protein
MRRHSFATAVQIPPVLFLFLLGVTLVLLTAPVARVQGADRYVDINNPTGLPDITQNNSPVPNGICAAATMANFMWDLSDAYRVGNQPLVNHPASQDPAQNWPATFGNWSADSIALRDDLAFWIYQVTSSFLESRSGGLDTEQQRERKSTWPAAGTSTAAASSGVGTLMG